MLATINLQGSKAPRISKGSMPFLKQKLLRFFRYINRDLYITVYACIFSRNINCLFLAVPKRHGHLVFRSLNCLERAITGFCYPQFRRVGEYFPRRAFPRSCSGKALFKPLIHSGLCDSHCRVPLTFNDDGFDPIEGFGSDDSPLGSVSLDSGVSLSHTNRFPKSFAIVS